MKMIILLEYRLHKTYISRFYNIWWWIVLRKIINILVIVEKILKKIAKQIILPIIFLNNQKQNTNNIYYEYQSK